MEHRVLLVEDSVQICDAISHILLSECMLLGCVGDGSLVLAEALRLLPNVLVLDISLPHVSGLALLPQLRAALPDAVIVMLTTHSDEVYIREAFRRGADAYVLKGNAHHELLPAIRRGRTMRAAHGREFRQL